MLSNKAKRDLYDMFGVEGLRGRVQKSHSSDDNIPHRRSHNINKSSDRDNNSRDEDFNEMFKQFVNIGEKRSIKYFFKII